MAMRSAVCACLIVVAALLLSAGDGTRVANAQGWTLAHTLLNPSAATGDEFGYFVAATPGRAIIGAPFDDASATDAGAAHLFDTSSGALLRTFTNPTPATGDWFGISVGMLGSNVLVGARQDNTGATDAGAAYLLDAATGATVFTFLNPTPAADDLFGYPVAPVGGNALISAIHDDTATTDAGAVYLFSGTTGALIRTILNPTPAANDWFGYRIAALGSNALVAAPLDSTAATANGVVHLFNGSTGALIRTFQKPVPADSDRFGWSVAAVGNNNVLIGAPLDDAGATNSGAAYLFDGSTGALLRTFTNPTPATDDNFGWSVAAVGNDVLISAVYDNTGGTDSGAAYLFDGTSGALLHTFTNPTPAAEDYFGWWTGGSLGNVLIGAPKDDAGATDAGAAYIFEGPVGGVAQPPAANTTSSRWPRSMLLGAIAAACALAAALTGGVWYRRRPKNPTSR